MVRKRKRVISVLSLEKFCTMFGLRIITLFSRVFARDNAEEVAFLELSVDRSLSSRVYKY